MTSCHTVPGSALGGRPRDGSPTSKPTNAPSAFESWPFANGYGAPPPAPQNSAWKRPNVWPSSCPVYQSPYDPSVSQPHVLTPVGPEATVDGSATAGIPEASPRMKNDP